MRRKTGFLEVAFFVFTLSFVWHSCGTEPSKKKIRKSLNVEGENNQNDLDAKPDSPTSIGSLDAFKLTTYPLLTENCGGCHDTSVAPFFAADDVTTAHNALVDGHKVNFDHPEDSRVVLRLSEDQHNCWSGNCQDDADTMEQAIIKWNELISEDDNRSKILTISHTLTLSDASEVDGDQPTDTYIWEAENFTSIEAPMRVSQVTGASGGSVIEVPAGNGGRIVDLNITNNVGFVSYQVDIKEAGTYKLHGRMSVPDGNSDSIFFSIDGGPFIYWTSGVASTEFIWNEAANGQTRLDYSIALDVGVHTIRMRRREELAKFDMFALSSNPNFNGGMANSGSKQTVLDFDISDLVGAKASFRVKAQKFDDFSLIFKNPEIVLESGKIYVKSIYFLINGKKDPQAATYSIVDTEVSAPGQTLSDVTMVQPFLVDPEKDEIQVSFEVIEAR